MNINNKKIAAGILTVFLALIFIFPAAAKNNIALECKIDSFCCESIIDGGTAEMLVDGDSNFDTKWHADNGENHPGKSHWIILDFETEKVFDSVRLTMASQGAEDFGRAELDASGFIFEISPDKIRWTKIFEVSDNEADIFDRSFPAAKARYLKLTVTCPDQSENSNENQAVRLYDLKVFEYISPFEDGDDKDKRKEIAEITDAPVAKTPIYAPETSDSPLYLLCFAAISFCAVVFIKKYKSI